MVARTLETRLSARLLALAVVVLASVGIAAALVTSRALEAADEGRARDEAAGARNSLAIELSEGDSRDQAAQEIIASSKGEGVRVTVRFADGSHYSAAAPDLPRLAPGTCGRVNDTNGTPWFACAAEDPGPSIVSAVPIAAHRAAVTAVWRAMAAFVTITTLLLWYAIRRALRAPLTELTSLVRWTGRLQSDRNLEREPAPAASTREIAHLASAFDALVRDLLETLARERVNSAHIAHELRTPLTAILAELDGFASTDPAARDAALRIRTDVARLADVIEAILVLSDQAAAVPREVVNVADVARELAPKGVELEAPDEALVEADERLVRLALRNLLDNAGKYGGGARVLRISRRAAGIRIEVIDHGAGLDAAARERMFDRFWRLSTQGGGRGLGLALVRAVAERHGGAVEAVPGPCGKGLNVSLTLGNVVGWHEPRGAPWVAR